ncbi:MAG TPA: hypothetical protein VMW53_05295 [archaeon]|nr:hypothetical protein [archaeon]
MLQIHINRNKINSIEFEKPEIKVPLRPGGECSFEIAFINYGTPTRVHLSATDSIRDYVTFLQDNPYVTNQEWVPVVVKLPSDISIGEGKIKVTTGYGTHTETIKVHIGEQKVESKPKPSVDVDTKLGNHKYNVEKPKTRDRKVDVSAGEKKIRKPIKHEKLIIPFLMILLVIWILLITFVIEILDPRLGALSVSIILISLIFYGAVSVLSSNSTKKEE